MNELATLTQDELMQAIDQQRKRAEFLTTKRGQARALQHVTEILAYLNASGYRLPTKDTDAVAAAWTDQLSEVIAEYGFEDLQKSVRAFVMKDTREYKQFPNTGVIIAEMRANGRNPKAELSRREKEAREAELERQWAAEKAERRKAHPVDEINAFRARYMAHREAVANG